MSRSPLASGTMLALAGLAALVLAFLGDVLLLPGDLVASKEFADASFYFARIREFAFAEMASGNLPLWNPHIFGGQPLLGTFQPALLYPLNLPYFVLPLAKAMNFDFALHVFLTGAFTFAWVRSRGVSVSGAFFAGALMMLAGVTSFRVMAGQLSLVASNAWAPLVLLAVERSLERPDARWVAIGIAAASCQILAGYPFSALATAFLAAATIVVRMRDAPERVRSVVALGAIGAAPVLIAAAQLFTGAATLLESTRASGVGASFARTHSLPVENLFTTLLPDIFGGLLHEAYWGSSWFWDASIFLGAPAIALAIAGARAGTRGQLRLATGFMLVLFVLALGGNTPLFDLCYRWIPGFDLFRAPSKFAYFATLYLALLAAIAIDRGRDEPLVLRPAAWVLAAVAGIAALMALWIPTQIAEGQFWSRVLHAVGGNRIYTLEFVEQTGNAMRPALLGVAAVSAACAGLLAVARHRVAVPAALAIALLELFYVARIHRGEFSLADLARPELDALYAAHPGDHRYYPYHVATPSQQPRLDAHEAGTHVLDHSMEFFVRGVVASDVDLIVSNHAITAGALSIWGYDPMQLGRTIEFLSALAKQAPGFPPRALFVTPILPHPLMGLLRTRYVIDGEAIELPDALPRFLFLNDYQVVEREAILHQLFEPDFDPRKLLLLEEEPHPAPKPGGRAGTVTWLEESTDALRIRVEAPDPTLLLITDVYAEGWRVRGLGDDAKILPADLLLRAIPIPAGTHELTLEYSPRAYRIGLWVSVLSTCAYVAFVARLRWRRS
jgi:hypothetical protein